MAKKELKGVATPEQISGWKNLYQDVFSVTVEESICYLKKPDRNVYKAFTSVAQTDPIRANEVLLDNCWLGGDEAIKTEDEKFFGVIQQIAPLISFKQAELKKL